MNTVLFDLQAAVMAAAASSGSSSSPTEIPEDGMGFSDVLAAQAAGSTAGAVTEDTAAVAEDDVQQDSFSEIRELIENADDAVKKALKKLLELMLKALNGSDDGEERKTDMFMLLSDGSAFGEDDDSLLVGAEMLSQLGISLESEEDSDEALSELEELLNGLFDDDDTDENTAAELIAAMMNASVQGDDDFDAVKNAAEILSTPKQAIAELNPEDVPEMEQLFSDVKAFAATKREEAAEMFRLGFNTVKINNAEEQLNAINGAEAAEMAAANAQPEIVPQNTVTEVEAFDAATGDSVEIQVREVITEKLMDIEGENGTEELTMILKPENLGEVAVKLIKENGAVTVLLSAQYDDVGKLMADRAASLSTSLQNQNYNVKDVQVVAANNAAEQMGLDFTNQGFGFMHNSNGSNQGGNNSNYRGIDGIDEIEMTEAETGTARLKEAKLWTTA